MSGDRFGSEPRRRSRIDRVGADPPHGSCVRSSVRPASSSANAACSAWWRNPALFPAFSPGEGCVGARIFGL